MLLAIIYIAFISLGLPDSLLGSAWPSMYQGMSAPISFAGIISMCIAGGTIVSSILSDRLTKRFGAGLVTAISVLMTAAALMGFSFAGSMIALCACAIPLGLGAGSVDAALNNHVALHYKAKHMNWLHSFWGIGASLGPVIMAFFLVSSGSWRYGYRSIGIIQFILVVVLFMALPLWKKQAEVKEQISDEKIAPIPLNVLAKLPGAKAAFVSFFCYCTIEATTGLWGSSYLVMIRGISPEVAARWISLYYFGITFGRMAAGFLAIRLSNKNMIALGLGFLSVGIVSLFFSLGNAVLLAGFFMIGLGCAPIFPGLLHETPAHFGTQNSQAMMGVQMASAYVGTTFMPPLFGLIGANISYALLPLYLGLIAIVLLVMVRKLGKLKN